MTATEAAVLRPPASKPKEAAIGPAILKYGSAGLIGTALLYLVFVVYMTGEVYLALAMLVFVALGFWFYLSPSPRLQAYRYLYPGLLGMGLFVVLPLVYTVSIAFSNFKAGNVLTYAQARDYFLDLTYVPEGGASFKFALHPAGDGHSLAFSRADGQGFVVEGIDLSRTEARTVKAEPLADPAELGEPLAVREIVQRRAALQGLTVEFPDGAKAVMTGLRDFGARAPLWVEGEGDALVNAQTGQVLTPDFRTGKFVDEAGRPVDPGFRVNIGFRNFERALTDPGIQGPFLQIFVWTVLFSLGTVVGVTSVGMVLGVLLTWDALRFRGLYRILLILPYAVPSFISLLIFRGLFNESFGEINMVLQGLFGLSPKWFSDPFLAKIMLILVNTWLGYPYVMLLTMGLLQAIPKDLYEASAIDGAGPIRNFAKITFPQILRPLIPLLIAIFAFNFNNFTIINLLTGGRPDIIGAKTPAGETDILVSYAFRIAFQDAGQDFALASAIATLIFFVVAALAYINLRLSRPKFD